MASPGLYWSMLILLEFILSFAASELTNSPRNQTLRSGETVNIQCSTNLTTSVFWSYRSIEPAASRVYVYRGSTFKMDPAYRNNTRYRVDEDKTTGHYNLIISDVQTSDAGTYICSDSDGTGKEMSNEVIILSDSPSCGSNIASGEAVGENNCGLESEDIELNCSVKYFGNVPPIMEFRNTDNNDVITSDVVRKLIWPGSEVAYTLTLKSSIDVDTSKISCAVKHDFLGNSANISAYTCLSKRINILYAFGVSPSLVNVKKDKIRICTADANLKNCTYLWKDTKTNSEVGRSKILRLSKDNDGHYDCSAKCWINGKTCELKNLPPPFPYEQQNGGSSAVIALAVILALVVLLVIILLVYIICQRLRSSSQEKETPDIELDIGNAEPLLGETDPENLPPPRDPTNAGSQMVAVNASEKGKNVMGVTWLDNKIYVLLDGKQIHVFSDQIPFNKSGDPIKVDEIMNPTDITSWSVDNCLFISDYSDKNCFWKIQMATNEVTSHTTSGKTSKLSVAKKTQELLVIVRGAKSAYLEIHKLSDLRFSMIFNFPEEIRKPVGVLKASKKNILVLYAVEADHYLVGEISDENIPKIVRKFDFTGPGVDSPKADHVAVDRHGRVFVSDLGNGRIFMLNKGLGTSKKIQMDLNSYRLSYVEEKNMLIAATWSPGSFTVFYV